MAGRWPRGPGAPTEPTPEARALAVAAGSAAAQTLAKLPACSAAAAGNDWVIGWLELVVELITCSCTRIKTMAACGSSARVGRLHS